ncbi:hypothetical protein Tco_1527658, partial [Tanacetum coccineum]
AAGPSTENIDKEVVDLSEDTRVPSPSIIVVQPSPHAGHGDTQEHIVFFDAHSINSIHHEDDSESTVEHRFVIEWGLRDDLREEFLSYLTSVEVVKRAYQLLGQCVISQGELLRRHEQLNRDHVDLRNRNDTQLEELNRLRNDL